MAKWPAKIFLAAGLAGIYLGLALAALLLASPAGARPTAQLCPAGPSIAYTPANPDPNVEVRFTGDITATGSGGSLSFTWDFGDGSAVVTGSPYLHTYFRNGVFTVIMTVSKESCSPLATTDIITVGFGRPAATVYLPLILKGNDFVFPTESATVTPSPPEQVANLRGYSDIKANRTYLSWTPVSGVSGYRLYRQTRWVDEDFELLAIVPGQQATFIDATAGCGVRYYVTAFSPAGESPASTASYYSPPCP
jgi:hypothetical protein